MSNSATLWTVAHQVALSMRFSRQDTGVGCHFLLQGVFLTQELSFHLLYFLHWQVNYLALPGNYVPPNSISSDLI